MTEMGLQADVGLPRHRARSIPVSFTYVRLQPKKYRTLTSREVWTPWAFFSVYTGASCVEVLVAAGVLHGR
jgi:hypothetical protein